MTRGPGFVEEAGVATDQPATPATAGQATAPPPLGPTLFDVDAGTIPTTNGKIGNDWDPRRIEPRHSGSSSLGWAAIGGAMMISTWLLVALVDFMLAQFRHSAWIGGITAGLFAVALSLVANGVIREISAWRKLRHIERLSRMVRRVDVSPDEMRAELLPWVEDVRRHLPEPDAVIESIASAKTILEITAILRNKVTAPLKRAADRAAVRAAVEGGALVAVVPSPKLEGVIAGARALMLVREVAGIYGIRPTLPVTLNLLRRVAGTVVTVAAVDALTQTVVERTLHNLPVAKHLFGALPETGTAGLRLYRLGSVVASACSPLSEEINFDL